MKRFLTATALMVCMGANAASLDVPVNLYGTDGSKNPIGTITISETEYGLMFTPKLTGLPAGIHGFHVHENPSCAPVEKDGKLMPAQAAGGHFDPEKTGQHLGPYAANGHLGDLPALYVDANGVANYPVLAPRLKELKQIVNRSIMVHAGADNHSDQPAPLGGGGARLACGVIKY